MSHGNDALPILQNTVLLWRVRDYCVIVIYFACVNHDLSDITFGKIIINSVGFITKALLLLHGKYYYG